MRAILGVTFSVSSNPLLNNALSAPSRLSDIKYVDLVPNGDEVYVDHSNKHQFVDLFVQHALHKSCEEHINKFILGLRITEVTENAMTLCSAREVEGIICGKKELTDDDISVLRLHTTYKGVFHDEHPVIHWFWEVLSALSVSLKYKFLEFVTGSDRLPIGGISKVGLIIQSTEQDCNALPSSHTCFNILELPRSYVSADQLRSKLVLALEYSRGFGFA